MGRIYLVRHGQASLLGDDYDKLSEAGHEQSRVVGKWLACRQLSFQHVVTGSLRRHEQTALACLPYLQNASPDLVVDADLDEYHHENMVSVTGDEYAVRDAMKSRRRKSSEPRSEFKRLFSAAFARWVSGEFENEYRLIWRAFQKRNVAAVLRLAALCGSGENALVYT